MSFLNRNSARTETSSTTTNTSQNINLQDTEGFAAGEVVGNVTVINTDHNAFDNASRLAMESLAVGEALSGDSMRLSLETLNSGFNFGDQISATAFGTVDKALAQNAGVFSDSLAYQNKALEAVGAVGENAMDVIADSLKDAFSGALEFVRGINDKAQSQLGQTVTSLNAIAVEQNKSTDQRVAEISENATKYMLYAVGAIAAAVTIYAIVRR